MKSKERAKGQGPKDQKRSDGYVVAAAITELQPGKSKVVEVEGQSVALFNVQGEYFALANLCSHDNGPLGEGEVFDHEVMCPWHGARFDLRTGKVLSFPAVADVPAYPVKVEGDKILIKLPAEN